MKTFNRFLEESYSAKYNLVEAPQNPISKAAGPIANVAYSALDAKQMYDDLRKQGVSHNRALLASGLNALGSGVGGVLGAGAGGVLGLPTTGPGGLATSLAGGTLGSMGGSALVSPLVNAITTKPQSGAAQAATSPKPQQRPQQLPQNQPANQRIPQGSRSTGIDPSRSVLQQRNINQPLSRQLVSQQTGTGGRVAANTAYQSTLGGVRGTTTYGTGGQQIFRANLGNQGVNRVASGQAAAGRGYGATLGGVRGTVTYDPQGNRTFQAFRQASSQPMTQRTGAGGTVSTNRAYQSRLGGASATTTYGPSGQQMIRANLGNQGVNRVSSGQAAAGRGYGATLGGVKGTVTYDPQGNRRFQALRQPASQAITQRAGAGGTVSTNRAYQSRLGGASATTTYGTGGQRMIRANLGRSNKPTPQPTNRTFGATLGGVKGTVTYDRSGNRQFKALQRPR